MPPSGIERFEVGTLAVLKDFEFANANLTVAFDRVEFALPHGTAGREWQLVDAASFFDCGMDVVATSLVWFVPVLLCAE